ncbi:MAG: 5-oxoprolinase subunit B family protein [Marmoricola sp.]
MEAVRVGEQALLVECGDAGEVAATYALLLGLRDEIGFLDLVPAARTVLVDGLHDLASAAELISGLRSAPGAADPVGPLVEIPTTYDGADLDEVARQWQVTTDEVIRIHTAAELVVAFCGFAPGFAYCTGLPEGLTVARRDDPRSRVPAGSVALAAEFTSVYPTASPGGWQLIGRTVTEVWRPQHEQPVLLPPSTRVRFVEEGR